MIKYNSTEEDPEPGVMVHACNLSPQRLGAVQGQLELDGEKQVTHSYLVRASRQTKQRSRGQLELGEWQLGSAGLGVQEQADGA